MSYVAAKGGRSDSELHLLVTGIFGLLGPDVCSHGRFIETHSRHKVPARPEILARKVPLLATELPRNGNRTLAL